MTSFKLQNNFERKQHLNNDISMTIQGSLSNQIINNDSLIENLRVLVKEYLEIVILKIFYEKLKDGTIGERLCSCFIQKN